MSHSLLSIIWSQLWQSHSNAKEVLRFSQLWQKSTSFQPEKGVVSRGDENREKDPNNQHFYEKTQLIGLIVGPALFALILLFFTPEDLSAEGRAVLATTALIATWWITEALPIPVTSLLPIILLPITGALDSNTVTASYGDSIIFLFLGGFLIALAMEKWALHKRVAVIIISFVGTSTERLVLGFMIATGFLSMWISNTAAAMMMVPIGSAIIKQAIGAKDPKVESISKDGNFSKAMMLGIAYSASIGGVGTLIGATPNMILAGVINQLYGIQVSFGGWMLFGVPLAVTLMAITWVYLVKIAFPNKVKQLPGGKALIEKQKRELGKITFEEKMVLTIFLFAAFMWITRSFIWQSIIPSLNDTVIALTAAAFLFVIPSVKRRGSFLLDWGSTKQLPWGILLLFGGGLAIAAGFRESGLAAWIGDQLTVLQGFSFIIILILVTTLIKFLTEVTSNTATATMVIPIMAALAGALDVHPYALMIPAALSAACAFMLPVATPPNAVVFASGYMKIGEMAKAGFWMNVISVFLIVLAVYFLLPIVWGIDLFTFSNLNR